MEVTSFTIDHDKLLPGVYVSRKDKAFGGTVTTFDIRMKKPNTEPCMDNPSIHTIEHLMAVYLRGHKEYADKILYVGPMGCRTGMYLILIGDYESKDIIPMLKDTFSFIMNFNEPIPATTSKECGNYLDHNLNFAKWDAERFYSVLLNIKEENLNYPK